MKILGCSEGGGCIKVVFCEIVFVKEGDVCFFFCDFLIGEFFDMDVIIIVICYIVVGCIGFGGVEDWIVCFGYIDVSCFIKIVKTVVVSVLVFVLIFFLKCIVVIDLFI